MASDSDLSTADALVQLSFLIQGTLERIAGARGISLIQARLLGVLRDREPTINELATILGLDKSSVSGLVDRAERRGLVSRRPSDADRRSVLVALTAQSRELVDGVAAEFERALVELLGPLVGEERASLTNLLSRILLVEAERHGIDLLPSR